MRKRYCNRTISLFKQTPEAIELISTLDPRQQRIIQLRLSGLTLKQIGAELNISEEYARHLEAKALRMLRQRNRRRKEQVKKRPDDLPTPGR